MEETSKTAGTAEASVSQRSVVPPEPSCSDDREEEEEPTVNKCAVEETRRRPTSEKLARGLTKYDSWKKQRKEEDEAQCSPKAGSSSGAAEGGLRLSSARDNFVTAFHCIAGKSDQEGVPPTYGKAQLRKLLNSFNLHPSDSDLDSLFQEWTGDSNKGVSEEVYVDWMMDSMKRAGIGLDAMEQVFQILDVDGSGALGMKELKQALAALEEEVPDNLVSDLLKSVGDNSRERLTQTDLYKYVNHFANSPLGATQTSEDYDSDVG